MANSESISNWWNQMLSVPFIASKIDPQGMECEIGGSSYYFQHMNRDYRLLFGPAAAAILALGIAGLALLVPGYDHGRQTVSEIGEIGSPARVPFAIMLGCVAACILVFAIGIRDWCLNAGHSQFLAWLIGFMALSATGIGIFAYPHPLHNVFGISELIAYQAPLFLALTWRRDSQARTMVVVSWILFAIIVVAIVLNLSSIDRQGAVWAYVRPAYGLAQRLLFAAWFGWCAAMGFLVFRSPLGAFPTR
ncbi:MAG TPA: DUF998 domain-containing protein [Chthoniobacterales bacterium]